MSLQENSQFSENPIYTVNWLFLISIGRNYCLYLSFTYFTWASHYALLLFTLGNMMEVKLSPLDTELTVWR